MISRNQSHYIIMSALYIELADFNFAKGEYSRNAEEVIKDLLPEEEEEVPLFILDSVNLSLLHYGEAVNAITPYLTNWKFQIQKRISRFASWKAKIKLINNYYYE